MLIPNLTSFNGQRRFKCAYIAQLNLKTAGMKKIGLKN
jgi:hypothetical protein